MEYCLVASAFGAVGMLWSDDGIVRVQLPATDSATTLALLTRGLEASEAHPPDWLAATVLNLQRYFTGARIDLSQSPLDLADVPEFNLRLYTEMLTLGWGEAVTYGDLAARVGAPGAAQAVGRAMGSNPVPIIVPCHRVLASGRQMGGFSSPGGKSTKRKLLDLEGIVLGDETQMAFAF